VSDQPDVPVAWEDLEGVPQGSVNGLHDGDLLFLGVAPSHLDQNARHSGGRRTQIDLAWF
jgi:hypothetical protein